MYTTIKTKLGYNQSYAIVHELRDLGFESDVTDDGLRAIHPRCMWTLLRETVETIPGVTLHPFSKSGRVIELTDPLLMTARTYLGEYHKQYDSSRVLNELVAMLPPNGTGLYTIDLLRTTFSDYVKSIPNGSRTMANPAVIER